MILKLFALLLISISLISCDSQSAGSFFEDPPDCFYDNLFGCGTFDIPSNSSYYGYFRKNNLLSNRSRINSSPNYSGSWSTVLTQKSSSCDFKVPKKLNSKFSLKQVSDRLTANLPISAKRSLTLRGKASSMGYSLSSVGLISLCSYSAKADLKSASTKSGKLDLNLRVSCLFQKSCQATYSGKASR